MRASAALHGVRFRGLVAGRLSLRASPHRVAADHSGPLRHRHGRVGRGRACCWAGLRPAWLRRSDSRPSSWRPVVAPLAFLGAGWVAMAGAVLWGVVLGVENSVLTAGVAHLVPDHGRARAYGTFSAIFGIAWFLGSALSGRALRCFVHRPGGGVGRRGTGGHRAADRGRAGRQNRLISRRFTAAARHRYIAAPHDRPCPHPQFLHRRPYRPWQIHAGRPADPDRPAG